MPFHEKKANKVAIIGFAESKKEAPYDSGEFEIWGCNTVYSAIPRIDTLFEIHSRKRYEKYFAGSHLKWLKSANIPIYMDKQYKDIKTCIVYPRNVINKNRRYFTNTISYMIALAIEMKYEEIHLYGTDMVAEREMPKEMPSVQYFVGLAEGKGIKIYIPDTCQLLQAPYLYGFEDGPEWEETLNRMAGEYKQKIKEYTEHESLSRNYKNQYQGALESVQYLLRTKIHG